MVKIREAKLIGLRGDADASPNAMGDVHTPLSVTDRPNRQKISGDTVEPDSAVNQPDLTDTDKTLQQQQRDTHASQAPMEHSVRQTTFGATKHTCTYLKQR